MLWSCTKLFSNNPFRICFRTVWTICLLILGFKGVKQLPPPPPPSPLPIYIIVTECFVAQQQISLLFNLEHHELHLKIVSNMWWNQWLQFYTCQLSRLRLENFDLTPAHACGPISHAWLKNVSCCRLLDTISKNMLTETHVRNENHV